MNIINDLICSLSVEGRNEIVEQIEAACRTMAISTGANHLYNSGYLYEDYEPASVMRTDLFDEGEHFVYVWKHANGIPFYVGSGKGRRSKDISHARPDKFYAELFAFDAVLCYIALDVSKEAARFIENYCSFVLSKKGINLTNKDGNVFFMTEKSTKRREEMYNSRKVETTIIDSRINFLLSKYYKFPEHYNEIVKKIWRERGMLYHLKINDNFLRALKAIETDRKEAF